MNEMYYLPVKKEKKSGDATWLILLLVAIVTVIHFGLFGSPFSTAEASDGHDDDRTLCTEWREGRREIINVPHEVVAEYCDSLNQPATN